MRTERADTVMSLLQEVRIALRRLRRRPGETLTAVLALAVGIGLTVTLFGIFHGSFLRTVPQTRRFSAEPSASTADPPSWWE